MFSKTNLISTLVGAIWTYFGGFFLWEVVGPYFFSSNEESNPEHLHLIIACLITAFAFSTIYSKWARGHHSVSEGAQFGLWVGILIGFGERWFDLAFSHMALGDTIVNGILNLVVFTVLGIITSLIYGKFSSASTE
ncbi:hypothetical protein RXV94_03080 [Yeosuana sp. MJ-SS3]|uniref:DUF1761 domain-containing protein n=1 Tax=Gilvirhabdus luticola TaxID=3079858 RepID=A0ABU3U3Z4_9FLAO|nr:hypothetical protein [Yeosuana sp. MJ-SS3]MDU8885129.1 hypothetical protein [Yeosuana sp. MJ-SS3]